MSSSKTAKGSSANEAEGGTDAVAPSLGRRVWEQVSTLVLAVAIALGIRAFIIEPFRIPSGSMLPTLLIGDHLFVNKFTYGVRIPFTETRLPPLREPKRGDVVVFSVASITGSHGLKQIQPADRQRDWPREDFVKRIVGLPGDRVEVRNGRVYVNDERLELVNTGETFLDERKRPLLVQSERLAGCEHAVLDDPRSEGSARSAFVVEPGRYFMMGDNRDYSNDSRGWGTVRFEEFKGPAFILYWSWSVNENFLGFLNPVNWMTAEKRWGRIFKRVKCDSPGSAA